MGRRQWWYSGALILVASIPGFLFTSDPVARDQGVFAQIGWRWLAGDVPYASAGLEHKGPLPFAAYALSQLLFGHSIESARLLAWLAMVVTALLLTAIASRHLRREGGAAWPTLLVGPLYVLVVGAGGLSTWWSGAQAESFMEPFLAGGLLLALGGHPLAAGAALGVATLGKPLALFLVPAMLAAGVANSSRRALEAGAGIASKLGTGLAPKPVAGITLKLVTGLVLPWLVTLVYFQLQGALPDFIDGVFLVNADYGRRGLLLGFRHLDGFVGSHVTVIPALLLIPAAVGAWLAARSGQAIGRVLLLWLLGAYLEVLVQGRFFGYHYGPIVGPLALAVAWAAADRTPAKHRMAGWTLRVGLAGCVLASLLQLDWRDVGQRWQVRSGSLPRAVFLESLAPKGSGFDLNPAETERVAAWVAVHTTPDETLLVWGFEPGVNFLARRRSPTRFLYDWYLTSGSIDPERQARYWSIFWREVEAEPPSCVVVVHDDANPVERLDSAAQLAANPRLAAWLAGDYIPEVRIGDFELYRRTPSDADVRGVPR